MSALARSKRLGRDFYGRDSATVAHELLGARLIRIQGGLRMSGIISEVEAYGGPDDRASHAFRRTPRSAIMYGPPGAAYVYQIYGLHCCLNVVTDREGCPGAVLIRGILPEEGLEVMRARRGRPTESRTRPLAGLTDGPGKLCQALGITREENGVDMTTSDALYCGVDEGQSRGTTLATPRIGVRGDETALTRPWRFLLQL